MVAAATGEATTRRPQGRLSEIPLLIKIKARNLYLIEGLSWPEIGERCGWDAGALAGCASREKWTEEKKRRKLLLLQKADARMTETANEVVDAIAAQAEEHALSALRNVGEALARTDRDAAKDSQAYSATVKNLASTARLLREPLRGTTDDSAPRSTNIFFMAASVPSVPQKSEPKQAEAIDVESVAKPVTG